MVFESKGYANRIPQTAPPFPFSNGGPNTALCQPLLYDAIPDLGQVYRPMSLLSEGFKVRVYIASFTVLSNYLCSVRRVRSNPVRLQHHPCHQETTSYWRRLQEQLKADVSDFFILCCTVKTRE